MTADDANELLLRELGRINAELAQQRRLSAEVAHDLAGPAQVVLGLSELLLDDPDLSPAVRSRVEQIERTGLTLRSMVNELRRGMEMAVEQDIDLARVDFGSFVASVVDRARLLSSTKRIELDLHDELREATTVVVDAARLERAFLNLIGNAIKYSPFRSRVTVTVLRMAGSAVVEVSDEGPGISVEGQAHVFEVYHREALTSHEPGLGLGLGIARQIVEGHGGTVNVRSVLGEGATFALTIPLADDAISLPASASA